MKVTWSHTALNEYELCPKRYFHLKVAKDVKEPPSADLVEGREIHKALEDRITGNPRSIPVKFHKYLPIADRIKEAPGETLAEQKLALNRKFRPTGWFDSDVWVRGVLDVGKLHGDRLFVGDYKTGKVKDDQSQMQLFAALSFAHWPEVKTVDTGFIWLKYGTISRETYERDRLVDIWRNFIPRVQRLERAHEEGTFQPKPGGLCRKWCPVKQCQFHGGS